MTGRHLALPLITLLLFCASVNAQQMTKIASLINNQKSAEAIKLLKGIQATSLSDAEELFQAANCFYSVGMKKKAAQLWEDVLKLKPDFKDTHKNLMEYYLAEQQLGCTLDHMKSFYHIPDYKRKATGFSFENCIKIWISPSPRDLLRGFIHTNYEKTGRTQWGYYVFLWHANAFSYRNNIHTVKKRFRDFLKKITQDKKDVRPDVFCHSAGSALLLETLFTYPKIKLGHVIIAGSPVRISSAPKDPNDRPRRLHRKSHYQMLLSRLSKNSLKVTNFASSMDMVTRWCGDMCWNGYAGTIDSAWINEYAIRHRAWNLTGMLRDKIVTDEKGRTTTLQNMLLNAYLRAMDCKIPESNGLILDPVTSENTKSPQARLQQ